VCSDQEAVQSFSKNCIEFGRVHVDGPGVRVSAAGLGNVVCGIPLQWQTVDVGN